MAEFDFSELRNYLQGQADLGGADILLDEPWTLAKQPGMPAIPQRPAADRGPALVKPSAPAAPAKVAPPSSKPSPVFEGVMPAPRPVKKPVAAYESAESLDAFYDDVAKESVYAGVPGIARYEGPEHPQLLLLFPAPHADIPAGKFFESSTGEMLVRLFANLNVQQGDIGIAYFYKGPVARNFPPLLETALRKMLAKELSFIEPKMMVTFGEPLFHQVFGKGKVFNDCAGTDMDFNGVKTCSLVDAFAMAGDKQLKWVTWKVHIPRCSYFKIIFQA